MKFEEAMKELEEVVKKLESGETSLDESMELFEKGSDEAKSNMPLSNCTSNVIENATIEGNGENYIVTIVLKEQVNPTKADTDGLNVIATDIMYVSDIEDVVANEEVLDCVFENFDNTELKYKEYTIKAEITKDGKFVNITHTCEMDMHLESEANVGNTVGTGIITFDTEYTNFVY